MTAGVVLLGKANNQEAIQKRAWRRSTAISAKRTWGPASLRRHSRD